MKNAPMPPEARPASERTTMPGPEWSRALTLLDSDLRRRGAAEKTRRAYGIDCGQFAMWCTQHDLGVAAVTPRVLRRYASVLGDRRVAPATLARKLAALRALYK